MTKPFLVLVCCLQVQRRLEAAEHDAAEARQGRDSLAAKLQAREEEMMALEGTLSVLEQEVRLLKETHSPQR